MTTPLTDVELQFLQRILSHARSGATEELEVALDGGVPANLTSGAGDTMLILAAYHQNADTVSVLLGRGADHARVNDRGQTALGAAVFRQNAAITAILLEAGADPDLGSPSARDLAGFYQLAELTALLDR